jgi:hypothetical protein
VQNLPEKAVSYGASDQRENAILYGIAIVFGMLRLSLMAGEEVNYSVP